MTGPIAFLATPKATTTQAADAQASFTSVASTTDQNFALINAYIKTGKPWPVASRNNMLVVPFTPATASSWTSFSSATWPALDVLIPANVRYLWVIVGAQLTTSASVKNRLSVSVQMSGSGFSAISTPEEMGVSVSGGKFAGSRISTFPPTALVPGQVGTLQPVYQTMASPPPAGTRVEWGDLVAVFFV